MSNVVMALMASLGIDTSQFDKGLTESEKKANNFGGSLKKGLAVGGKAAVAGITALTTATVAGGTALVKGVNSVASYADEIDKMSQKMGISAEAYQEWDAVLQHSGTSISSMAMGMQTLQKNAVDSAEKFEALGLSQEQVANMSTEELFSATIKGLQDMGEGADRTALASDLLGRSSKELGALLNTSSEDTQKMIDTVHELGGVMSDDAVKAGATFQDNLQDMNTSITGLKNNMLGQLLPASSTVMAGLTKVFTGDTQTGLEEINSGVSDFANNITTLLPNLLSIGGTIISALITSFSENSSDLVSSAITVIQTILQALIQNAPLLMEGALTMLTELGNLLITLAPMLLESAIQIVTMLAQFLAQNADSMIPAIVELILSLAEILTRPDVLVPLVEAAGDIIIAVIKGIGNSVPSLIQYIPTIVSNIAQSLIGAVPVLITAVGGIVVELGRAFGNGLFDINSKIVEWVNGANAKFVAFIEGIKSIISAGLEKIRGFFSGLNIELPKIKLPHFKIDGEFSLAPPKVPSIGIDWYAKGYDDAYILNSASIFGAQGGKLLGGGERAGSEVVVGTQKLISMMSTAVRNAFDGIVLQANIPVYIGNKKLEDIIVKTQATMKIKRGK